MLESSQVYFKGVVYRARVLVARRFWAGVVVGGGRVGP